MKRWQTLAASGASAIVIAAALAFGWEGGNVNKAYWDAIGQTYTICAGHTRGVQKGDVATDTQCEAYLKEDMQDAASAVQRCIKAPLTEGQRAAFTDAAFNLGPGVVCGSTLQRKANSGDVVGACLQLTDALDKNNNYSGWTYGGGKIVAGLKNRRTEERNLCLGYLK